MCITNPVALDNQGEAQQGTGKTGGFNKKVLLKRKEVGESIVGFFSDVPKS